MPHRVIADHVRTLCFGIADNIYPSNEGKGYVLRRLLRRACRYAKKLGVDKPLLFECVDMVIDTLGNHFDHLIDKQKVIKKVILAEEESFLMTLSSGLMLFEKVASQCIKDNSNVISGAESFKLYDTFGFPIDLTCVLAEEKNLSVDLDSFQLLLNDQKERSRKSSKFSQQELTEMQDIVLPEQFDGLDIHLAEDLNVAKGGEARVISDRNEKVGLAMHHSATHILHEVLRKKLGTHVFQAGSLVDSNRLRFDFSHFEALKDSELEDIEYSVNEWINKNIDVTVSFNDLESAKKMGAMALFGEKYDKQRVRIVKMGDFSVELCAGTHVKQTKSIESFKIISESAISSGTRRIEALAGNSNIRQYLKEKILKSEEKLNTHFSKFKKQSNKKIIEMVDLEFSKFNNLKQSFSDKSVKELENYNKNLLDFFKVTSNLSKKIEREKHSSDNQLSQDLAKQLKEKMEQNGNIFLITQFVENQDMNQLRKAADQLISENPFLIYIVGSVAKDKGIFVVKCGKSIKKDAKQLMNHIVKESEGKGGGREDMAQAGGCNPEKLPSALNSIREFILNES